jgi:hypothetical protein
VSQTNWVGVQGQEFPLVFFCRSKKKAESALSGESRKLTRFVKIKGTKTCLWTVDVPKRLQSGGEALGKSETGVLQKGRTTTSPIEAGRIFGA